MKKTQIDSTIEDQNIVDNQCKQCGGQMEIITIGVMYDKIMKCAYCGYAIDIVDSFCSIDSNETSSYVDEKGNIVNQKSTVSKFRTDGPLDLSKLGIAGDIFSKHIHKQDSPVDRGVKSYYPNIIYGEGEESIQFSDADISEEMQSTLLKQFNDNKDGLEVQKVEQVTHHYTTSDTSDDLDADLIKMMNENPDIFATKTSGQTPYIFGTPNLSKDEKANLIKEFKQHGLLSDKNFGADSFFGISPNGTPVQKTFGFTKVTEKIVINNDERSLNSGINGLSIYIVILVSILTMFASMIN